MDEATLANLQKEIRIASTLGTAGETGTGFGFYQMRTQIERMSGSMELRSKPGSGTTVTFSLRVAILKKAAA